MATIKKLCGICMENKSVQQIFNKLKCSHTFCSNCISKHIVAKVPSNSTTITCPEFSCKEPLELDMCKEIITGEVFEMWDTALCESLYSGSKKMYYCPFEDCSVRLYMDDEGGKDKFRETECSQCHRLFCAQCEVPWHSEMQCEEFSRMKKKQDDERSARDDQMFVSLAEKEKWRSCPNCKFYVEKIEGCLHIACVCEFKFCYGCGSEWLGDGECCFDEVEDEAEGSADEEVDSEEEKD